MSLWGRVSIACRNASRSAFRYASRLVPLLTFFLSSNVPSTTRFWDLGQRGSRDRGDEAVAAPEYIGYKSEARLAITQQPAQRRDMKAEASRVHCNVLPDPRRQVPVAHDFARAFDQNDQDIQGAAADANRPGGPFEQPLSREQAEETE